MMVGTLCAWCQALDVPDGGQVGSNVGQVGKVNE